MVGISSPIESCLNIENKINDSIKPVPKYNLSIDDKTQTIILAVFESNNKPYLFKNKAYNRNDTSTVEVNRTEFGRLILEGNNINYESLPSSNQNLMFNDLNQLLNGKMQIENISLDIFKALNLYSNKDGYNKAAEFLSDTNSLNGINIVRYGKNENIIMKRIDLDNISILDQFNQSMIAF